MKRADALDHARRALQGPEPAELAENAIDLIMALAKARRAALFAFAEDTLRLVASRSLDQEALDLASRLYDESRAAIVGGAPFQRTQGRRPCLVLPCLDDAEVLGVLYLEAPLGLSRFPPAHLATFAGIFGRVLRGDDEREPQNGPATLAHPNEGVPENGGDNLLLLLQRNEWNVSRVARLLGLTRMTIYNRLRRMNVPRQHVRKTRRAAGALERPAGS